MMKALGCARLRWLMPRSGPRIRPRTRPRVRAWLRWQRSRVAMARQPAGTHLAQLNVGRIRYPTEDPRMAEFMGALERINALAERSPGFVWRLKSDSGNATDIKVTADPMLLINMSVWKT